MKFFTFFVFIANLLLAQEADTLKNYDLDEITVKSGLVLEPKSITQIDYKEIEKSDAASFFELGKFIPSVKMQTNSRGESLFYLRGSGERQLSLLFDGVPLNIPWDNRIDLNLIPTDAIGGISVTKGIPSIVYGANSLAGVISVDSKDFTENGKNKKFTMQFGENSFQKYSGYWLGGNEKYSYLISTSYNKTNGFRLPGSYNNPAANPSSTRINSFSESLNSFVKFKYNFSQGSEMGLSVSYINS